MTTNRICGAIILFFGIAYLIAAYFIPAGLVIETLGPRFYPLFIGSVFSLTGLILIIQNQPFSIQWPARTTWLTFVKILANILLYAFLITKLGFLISTTIAAFFLVIFFSGGYKLAAITGAGISFTLYLIFDILLEIPLPWGDWVSLFIEEF